MDVLPNNKQLYTDSLGLNENINTDPLDQDKNNKVSGDNSALSSIMKQIQQIPAASYNMANDTKWVFHIPYGFLFMGKTENRENLEIPLGCQSINFPDFKYLYTGFLEVPFEYILISIESSLLQK